MKPLSSGLYIGEVVHQRFEPSRHRLRYGLVQVLLDLDELPRLSERLRLFSHNRLNIFGFNDSDHGEGAGAPLRDRVEQVLSQAGLATRGGQIALLCIPRVFGYAFNPLSIYYCHNEFGALIAMIYEVNNTFGQCHTYLIPISGNAGGRIKQICNKEFFVSPFMDMNMTYRFTISKPGSEIMTSVLGLNDVGKPILFASFSGLRREISDAALWKVLMTFPFWTVGVVAAIHWEALKLFIKGIGLRRRPAPPDQPITVVDSAPLPGSR